MASINSFTFFSGGINELSWTVTDLAGVIVNTAAVTSTLYWGRSRINPDSVPGIAVTNFTGIVLTYNSTTQQYSNSTIFFTAPNGGDYLTVVDVKSGSGVALAHYEIPTVVSEGGQ